MVQWIVQSMDSFNQIFWLNLMTQCIFFNTNPWFYACFKFIMCITFSISFVQVKRINHYEEQFFRLLNISFNKISFITSIILAFYEIFIEIDVSRTHLKPSKGNFCDIANPHELFTCQYFRWFFIFTIIFHVFIEDEWKTTFTV